MFERFTDQARQAVSIAADEARELGDDHVAPQHILLGLLREEDGIAWTALEDCGVTLDGARAACGLRGGGVRTAGELPFDPAAKRLLERSLREAVRLEDNFIGAEHLLLGLLREEDGPTPDILEHPEAIRERLLSLRVARPERRRGRRAKLGRDAQDALSRARGLAEAEGASEVRVEHLRRALDGPGPD